MNFRPPKIYPITDTSISGLSHAEQVEMLIDGGAELIQLREKLASPRDFYSAAVVAVEFAERRGVPIIINDRVDIALATKAAGVHLGQHDMPPAAARAVLGETAIIGFSTHSLQQAQTAMDLPIDYVAIGPIFTTNTKVHPDEIVGLDGLRCVRDAIGKIPLVAIGGIDETRLRSIFQAGADSAAMIGALISDREEMAGRMRKFRELLAL